MFKLELLGLIQKYKKSNESEKENIINKITNLILENEKEFNSFANMETFDPETEILLKKCYEKSKNKENEIKEKDDDIQIIKKKFSAWLNEYNKNNKQVNLECEKIIEEIINFYIINRFEVLIDILKINDTQDFEDFKNMLKNYIRKYFAINIQNYFESEKFESLGFLDKRKKKKQIFEILDEIGHYKFNKNKIEEVIT